MYSNSRTSKSTAGFFEQLAQLRRCLDQADAVVVGAGAGLSAAAGLTYSGERFHAHFADFERKYGIQDMYSGGFYPFATREEYWAWWSRHILINRYDAPPGAPYLNLRRLLEGRDFFVLTTNVDHQFQLSGFPKRRLFYTQGDYGLWQCARACHAKTYENESAVREMAARQRDMRIPSELVPRCPVCGAPMTGNLRSDDTFVEDDGWREAQARYNAFLKEHRQANVLYLELGVGLNTPGIIKLPFWAYTYENPRATYACVNLGQAFCPPEIESRSLLLDGDLGEALKQLAEGV